MRRKNKDGKKTRVTRYQRVELRHKVSFVSGNDRRTNERVQERFVFPKSSLTGQEARWPAGYTSSSYLSIHSRVKDTLSLLS